MSEAAAALAEARRLAAADQLQNALAVVDRGLLASPNHLALLLLEGALRLESRQDAAALAVHEQAAAAWPRSSEALGALARCLHLLGRHQEALTVAERACRLLDEGDNFRQAGPVYLTMVWSLRDLRRYREALRAAEEGLRRTPDAMLAECASTVEDELAEAERERC